MMRIFWYIFFVAVMGVGSLSPSQAAELHTVTSGSRVDLDITRDQILYGQLAGEPVVYRFTLAEPREIMLGMRLPNISGQKKNVTAVLTRAGDIAQPIAILDAFKTNWQPVTSALTGEQYFQGGVYQGRVEAGDYEIRISSPYNMSRYMLSMGDVSTLRVADLWQMAHMLPVIATQVYGLPRGAAIVSILGLGYVIFGLSLGVAGGWVWRRAMMRLAPSGVRRLPHNTGTRDRWIRALLGGVCLIGALTTAWHLILFLFAGFCFFQAAVSWCGLYALLGRNTCPIA